MRSIARTQKILTFMSKTGERRQQKHTQHAPSTKTECDYLYGWIKKKNKNKKQKTNKTKTKKKPVTYAKIISPKMVNPKDIAGNAEEEEMFN